MVWLLECQSLGPNAEHLTKSNSLRQTRETGVWKKLLLRVSLKARRQIRPSTLTFKLLEKFYSSVVLQTNWSKIRAWDRLNSSLNRVYWVSQKYLRTMSWLTAAFSCYVQLFIKNNMVKLRELQTTWATWTQNHQPLFSCWPNYVDSPQCPPVLKYL